MTTRQPATAETNAAIGELVHQHMWRRKITQTQIGARIGIGQSAVARKLRGERPFAVDELMAIAAFLDVPITDLLPTEPPPGPDAPDGGDECARRDSNPKPSVREVVAAEATRASSQVIPLYRRTEGPDPKPAVAEPAAA
ncbi:hypothetical protein PBI_PIPP_38 [Gordonia phage Pipp]|nr:hypothetical protein PBI_PIPP_38 [Gordonia phage Pipp]